MMIFGFRKMVDAPPPVVNGSGIVIQQSRTTPPFSGIRIEVNSDIQEGDKLITVGYQELTEGQVVKY